MTRALRFEVMGAAVRDPPGRPTTYVLIGALLTATAAMATWRPARRAAAVDPVAALRAN
ncbi:MAG TPA: hypothetical protein VGI12_10320 [Vicinamibacterales bacterium]|jgi:hypothetical protein